MQALSLPSMLFVMEFPERVTALRKERGLTQQALADRVGVHEVDAEEAFTDVAVNLAAPVRSIGKTADVALNEFNERHGRISSANARSV